MLPDRLIPIAGSAGCPDCNTRVGPDAIVRRRPQWDDAEGSWVQIAGFYCSPCHQLVRWQERCDRAGGSVRAIRGSLSTVRDALAVREWIRRHPQAAGVVTTATPTRKPPRLAILLTQSPRGDWTASSAESPDLVGFGETAGQAIRELVRKRGDGPDVTRRIGLVRDEAEAVALAAPRLLTEDLLARLTEDQLQELTRELQEVYPGRFRDRARWGRELQAWYRECQHQRMSASAT